MGWGPVDWVGRVLPEAKFENKWTLFFELFLFERPLLTRDWKSESVTNLLTYQPTNLLTWVGARDTCVSKKREKVILASQDTEDYDDHDDHGDYDDPNEHDDQDNHENQ